MLSFLYWRIGLSERQRLLRGYEKQNDVRLRVAYDIKSVGGASMNDILFGNNNKAVIKKLAKRSFRSNTSRNAVALLAVFLTSFLICFIFSIGGSYIKSYQLQQQQLLGTTGQATLNAPAESQYEVLKQSDSIAVVGLRADVVMPSFVTAGSDSDGTNLYYGFRYYNADEWLNHRQPVLDNVVGHYPENSDEIMIPTWVLDKMGIANPEIGMELPFSYKSDYAQDTKDRDFRLSGWYDEFDYVKDGTVAYLLVSEAFCKDEMLDLRSWDAAHWIKKPFSSTCCRTTSTCFNMQRCLPWGR